LLVRLDDYYAAFYRLFRDELRYVLDPADVYGPDFPSETFPVLKECELREYDEYRTRRLVLKAWDRLGLAPWNRDGRYAVEAVATPSEAVNGKRKRSGERSAKLTTVSPDSDWPTVQAGLPGLTEAVQQTFGDVEGEE
jgi:hypothetical protein